MKKNRIFALLLAMIMVVSLLPLAAQAADFSATITVSTETAAVVQDTEVTFSVKIQSATKLAVVQLYPDIPAGMTYKAGSASVVGKATIGLADSDSQTYWDENAKQLGIVAAGTDEIDFTTATEVLTFTCVAAKGSATPVQVGMTAGDDGAIYDADYNAATITCNAAAVTVTKDPSKQTLGSLTLAYDKTAAAFGTANMADVVLTPTVTAMDDDETEPAPMATMPALTFTTAPASIDGVSVAADGKITIDKTAPAGTFTVKVSSGAVESAAVTVTVTKDAAVPTTVEIDGKSTLVIPVEGTATETYEAVVKDQYGAAMSDPTIDWTLTDSTPASGAALTDNALSVNAGAAGGTVKVKASVNGATPAVEDEIDVLVTSIDFNGKDAVTAKDNLVYGVGWDNIINGLSGLSVKVPAGVTGTFSIKEKAANTLPGATPEEGTTYHVVFNGTGYTDVPVKDVVVVIAKKPVNVTADDIRVYVNSDASEVEYSYTADKLVGEDKYDDSGVTYTLYATNEDGTKGAAATLKTDAVASYFIEVGGITASANYEITFVDGTLNVRKRNSNPPPFGQGTAPSGTDTGTTVTPVANPEFNDVKEGDWFYDSVMAVAKKGLMTGTADKVFSPTLNTTRAQIATILWREAGSPAPRARIADFPDVADGAWYADAVRWCTEQEIVNGFDDGTFRPNDNITREQMVAMMYRYADKTGMDVSATADLADFADADAVGTWAVEYVQWAVGAKLIQGKGEGNLDPQGLATRAEVATILQRFVEMGK